MLETLDDFRCRDLDAVFVPFSFLIHFQPGLLTPIPIDMVRQLFPIFHLTLVDFLNHFFHTPHPADQIFLGSTAINSCTDDGRI